jgi:hypothetical protein
MNKWNPEKLQEFIENLETVKVIDLENKLINSNNDNSVLLYSLSAAANSFLTASVLYLLYFLFNFL